MAPKNCRMSIKAAAVLLSAAPLTAEASSPLVSYTASGTGMVHLNGNPSPVSDSDSTADPLNPRIAFSAQQELVPGQSGYRIESHGDASVDFQSGLQIRDFVELELAYYPSSMNRPGGTGNGSIQSTLEVDLPSPSVAFSYALGLFASDFPRTVHIRAENLTDSAVLFDTTLAGEDSLLLSGQEGDRIRVLLEAAVSGTAPAGSANMVGSLQMLAVFQNVDDCNGNGQTDDRDELMGAGFDCNGNLVLDACDLTSGTSIDCNGNNIPDECETDCNHNGVQDTCDISAGTSEDCDDSGVPDECEPPEPDCNNNGIGDGCDLADGTSTDCNTDGVPDDCQPDEDCNENGVRDICDIGAGTSADCNRNLAIDSCDIASGTSADTEGDGIPDECQGPPQKGSDDLCVAGAMAGQPCAQHSECPGGFCHLKNRFITAEIPPTIWNALKVTLVNLDANSVQTPANYNGTDRWAGPPVLMVNDGVSPPFNAARTQCAFITHDWSALGRIHIYGDVIVPGSLYDVRGCNPQTTCSAPALRIATAKFGDVIPPLNVVNFQDVSAELAKFQSSPSGPSKTRAKLAASVPNLNTPIGFQDISSCVSAFQSKPFKNVVTTPPGTCP